MGFLARVGEGMRLGTLLQPGDRVDRYRVIRLRGAGGMAEVWEVESADQAGRHALKVSRRDDPEQLRRLLREGRTGAVLEHPNLLSVRDVIPVGGGAGLVMPLVDGPTLDALLRSCRPTEAEALGLLLGVAHGVAHAHAQGLVHRDLKPANVLLDLGASGVVPRVSDFGLVKREESDGDATRPGAVLGTPLYAAPEQLRDASTVDARADLWSLGVMLVELLTGRRPYEGQGAVAVAEAQRRGPRLEGLRPELAKLAQTLLCYEAAGRPSSAAVLVEALRRLGADERSLGADSALFAAADRLRTPGEQTTLGAETDRSGSLEPPTPNPHNLPAERDSFVGREADLQRLDAALSGGARLLTLVGPGGTGKTRLALRYAWIWLAEWPGGAWFCDLSEARSRDGVLSAVARALGVQLGREDAATQLGYAIAGRGRCLLVLDNAEQIRAELTEILGDWTRRAPLARFLVTSREPLGVLSEQLLPLDTLTQPDAEALFLSRAQAVKAGFRPSFEERSTLAALVERLDRLPLALELAAARVRVLPIGQILARLKERFRLLASTGERVHRQATLRATLDWSWALLTPAEQAALAQISVFEGGFTLEAAEAVLALPEGAWPLDAVQGLVEKSLVREAEGDRFALLVSVKEYAAEKLSPGDRAAAEGRHGACFSALGEDAAVRSLDTEGGLQRRRALGRDLDNLVSACRSAVRRGEGAQALGALRAAWAVMEIEGPYAEAARLVAEVGSLPHLSPRDETMLARVHGYVLLRIGALDQARMTFEQAYGRAQALEDWHLGCAVLHGLAATLRYLGRRDEARALLVPALRLAEERGETSILGSLLGELASLDAEQGQLDEAIGQSSRILLLLRASGNRLREGLARSNLGTFCHWSERLEEALEHLRAALSVFVEVGDRRSEALCLHNIAEVLHDAGRGPEGIEIQRRAVRLMRETGARRWEAIALSTLARALARAGQSQEAHALFEQALAAQRELGNRFDEGNTRGRRGAVLLGEGRLAEARTDLKAALELQGESDNSMNRTVWRCTLVRVELRAGNLDVALDEARSARMDAGEFNTNQTAAQMCLAEVHLARGELGEARSLIQSAGESTLSALTRAEFDAIDARLRAAEGDLVGARASLARSMANPSMRGPATYLEYLVQRAQEALIAP